MRKTLSYLLALAVLVPAVARAQWSVGARTGYAIPLGDGDGSAAMSDLVSGQIPIQLDVDYLVQPQLKVGGYFSYGFGSVAGATKDLCDAFGQSCSSSSLRIGAQLAWLLDPAPAQGGPQGAWLGLGLGYESITVKGADDLTISGMEFLILQGGHDWRVGQTGALGAFASFSLGQYSQMSGGGMSASIADKTMHQWLTFGLRGSFGIPK